MTKRIQDCERVWAAIENVISILCLDTAGKQLTDHKKRYTVLTFGINEGRVFGVMRLRYGTSVAIQGNRRKAVSLYKGDYGQTVQNH